MDEQTVPSIFEGLYDATSVRRKYMIPKWIRFFCWLFAILCPAMVLFAIFFGLLGSSTNLYVYGFESSALISFASILSIISLGLKGTAAIGLLAEKDWAVKIAIADGILSIVVCIVSMIINPWATVSNYGNFNSTHYNLRLEILLLIPYLAVMFRIRDDWEENKYALQPAALHD